MWHSTDIFGNRTSYSGSGTSYIHTTDMFGNRISRGTDGSEYLHTTDMFGNNVTYTCSSGSSNSPSTLGDFFSSIGGTLIVVGITYLSIRHILLHASWLFAPIGGMLLLFFIWPRIFGHTQIRPLILYIAFIWVCNNLGEAYPYYPDKPMGLFAYLGVGIIALIVLIRWALEDESVSMVFVLIACIGMYFYLFVYHGVKAEKVMVGSSIFAGIPMIIHEIADFIKKCKNKNSENLPVGSFLLSTVLMIASGFITLLSAKIFERMENIVSALALMTVFMICVPIIINRFGNVIGLRVACSPYGHLMCLLIMALIIPNQAVASSFIAVVFRFWQSLISQINSPIAMLLYFAIVIPMTMLIYNIVNKFIVKRLQKTVIPAKKPGTQPAIKPQQTSQNIGATQKTVSVNDLCPCGSGKRFKNCCGRGDRKGG